MSGNSPVDGSWFHDLHADLQGKVERLGTPKPAQLLGLLKRITPEIRTKYGWETAEISLRNPDHGVREIERTFRKLGWAFDSAKIVPGSKPPNFDLFLMMLKDLARYFDENPVTPKTSSQANAAGNSGSVWSASQSATAPAPAPSKSARSAKPELKYWVKGSKKGSFRITKERRKRGKVVTIVSNIGGDVNLMLKELRGALGTGGSYNAQSNCLEMQGDCIKAVEKWLVKQHCLVGVTAKLKASITKHEDAKKAKEDARKAKVNAVRQTQLERQRRQKQIDTSKPITAKELNTMKPDALKSHLKARGLSTQGSKKELFARLSAFLRGQQEEAPQSAEATDAANASSSGDASGGSWSQEQQSQLESALGSVNCEDPKQKWKLVR